MEDRRECFVDLYERHYDDVLRYVSRRTGVDQARDVTAEAFLVAWRRIDVVPEEALPWLYAVARRVLANHARGRRRSEQLLSRAEGAARGTSFVTEPDHAEAVTEDVRVRTAMARLSPGDQEVLRLIAWEDLDIRAAAAALQCSERALAGRLHRARRRLEGLMNGVAASGHRVQKGNEQDRTTIREGQR